MKITGHPVVGFLQAGCDYSTRLYCSNDGGGDTGSGTGTGTGTGTGAPAAPWVTEGNKPWTVGEGDKAQPWHNFIPEGPVRELMGQKNYANPAELATAYYTLNKMVSGNDNVVEIPGPNATQEQRDKFYNKLGRPVDPTKYDFNEVYEDAKKTNADFKPNEKLDKWARNAAHKFGLTNTQAAEMVADYMKLENELQVDFTTSAKAANDAAMEKVISKFGNEKDTFLAAGKRAFDALKLDETTAMALERAMGDAAVVDLLCRLGKASAEGTFKGGGSNNANPNDPDAMSEDQAAAEITRLRGDAEFNKAFTDKSHPEHGKAVERMNRLYAKAGNKALA